MAKKTKKRPRHTSRGAPVQSASGGASPKPAGREARSASKSAPAGTAAARQARKQEARKLREAMRRRAARGRMIRRAAVAVAIGVAAAVAVFLIGRSGGGEAKRTVDPGQLPGMKRNAPSTWTNGSDDQLKPRLQKMGLGPLDVEGQGLHADQTLEVFVHGKQVEIPTGIGIGIQFDNQPGAAGPQDFISTLHTHDSSGLVHVEALDTRIYTLGLFFDVWGVYFTNSCLGDLCNKGTDRLQVFSDGKLVSDPVDLGFSHTPRSQTVVVTYGTQAELPNPIPGT